ncbi:BC1881 family protein [Desulfosporosinus acididurans]|nr:BC1881 family protein [Desulfosporosinus acididurans]
MPDLSKISTKSLVDELRNREAVQEITAEPYQEFEVRVESERIDSIPKSGPAVILVIWD